MGDPSTSTEEKLTGILAEFAEAIGRDATLKIVARVGGTIAYFPSRLKDRSWLVECIGRDLAEKLRSVLPFGCRLFVPAGPQSPHRQAIRTRELKVIEGLEAGLSPRKVALQLGMADRTVRNIKARVRMRQQRLKGTRA